MKTIKLNKSLNLNIEYKDGEIKLVLNDRKLDKSSESSIKVHTCPICGTSHFSENAICSRCLAFINNYVGNKKEVKESKVSRKTKTIVNYNKGKFIGENIVIDNLTELHNLIYDYMSIGKLETMLKLIIMGNNVRSIAIKLNIAQTSVIRDCYMLSKRGIIAARGSYIELIPGKIQYHTLEETVDLPQSVVDRYNQLKPFMKKWTTTEKLQKDLNTNYYNTMAYLKRLNNFGLLVKQGTKKNREYKLKEI